MHSSRPLAFALATALLALAPSVLHAELATWSNLDGQAMKAEFLGRKGDYVSFRREDGSRYLYPYAKLTEADRARVDALATKVVAPSGSVSETPADPAPAAAPVARAGKLAGALSGKLVTVQNGRLASAPADQLNGAKYVAFYYSAKWCPPCRAFTPELVKTYRQIKARHPEFELVFVSGDESAEEMTAYMSDYKMGFPAIDFAARGSIRALGRPAHENGIPNLVFMDADGKELSLSFTSSGDYLGPRKVLGDIKKHFRM